MGSPTTGSKGSNTLTGDSSEFGLIRFGAYLEPFAIVQSRATPFFFLSPTQKSRNVVILYTHPGLGKRVVPAKVVQSHAAPNMVLCSSLFMIRLSSTWRGTAQVGRLSGFQS